MPLKAKNPAIKPLKSPRPNNGDAQAILASFERVSNKKTREEMSTRYGIHTDKAFGVMMRDMQKIAKSIGTNHELALALWDTGWYEARMAASMIDDPAKVTSAQMDRWCETFDNWAICDTVCFKLFDRTPHAWAKVAQWSSKRDEFVKRTAFALLWSLSVHDKRAGNKPFIRGLDLIERTAGDERNFVKKAVSMALRAIGKRNLVLNGVALGVAKRLSDSQDATSRWVGKEALRELTSQRGAKRRER